MTPAPFPTLQLPEIVGTAGLLTDGDWVESKDQDPSGTIRLTQLADIGDGVFLDRSDRRLNEEQAARLGVTYLAPNDVLVARMPDPLGRACVCPALPTRAITVVDVCVVRAPAHNARWIMHALNAPQTRGRVAELQSGSTRKRISKGNLSTVPLPMPPRATQDRLVAAIDTHLSRLDAAVASLTHAKTNVANARASVLKAAVEGRLVRRAGSPASESWPRATVGDAAEVTGGLTKNATRSRLPQTLPYLRVANVYANELRLADVATIGVASTELPRVLLQRGDVLIVEGNGSADQLGRVAVWSGAIAPCVHQNHLIKARPRPGTESRWLLYWMMSPAGRSAIQAVASSTSGLHTLSISKVQALPVPLPPSAIQLEIVAEVDRRMSVLEEIERDVDTGLARCARMRQAILKRAFEGRLVPLAPPEVGVAPRQNGSVEVAR